MIEKGNEKEGVKRMKRFLYILNSMTDQELDGGMQWRKENWDELVVKMDDSRLMRCCLGAGVLPVEV